MKRSTLSWWLALATAWSFSSAHAGQPVLLISLDGLRPADVLDADKRHLDIPNLREFVAGGAYAVDVHGVLPTLTYPSHTTLVTGVAPARHGVVSNLTFDPLMKNQQGWYWYADDIQVPTLWDAAGAARISTANVHWPVTVGARIDYNLPQYWRTGHDDDRKLQRALSTQGLLDSLEHDLGAYAAGIDESIEGDENRARFAEQIIATRHPGFMTTYFTGLDHTQHVVGIDTPDAHAVLERLDGIVGRLRRAALKSDPHAVVAVVSDHGFLTLTHETNLAKAFVDAGLITFDKDGKVSAWEAEPWYGAGSAAIVLRDSSNKIVADKARALLEQLRSDPANGIERILDRNEIESRGGNPNAQFYVLFKPGYQMATDIRAPMVAKSKLRGMHGYDPDLAEMRSTFLIIGTGIPAARSVGSIDMRDVAPTLAKVLGIPLTTAQGKPLL